MAPNISQDDNPNVRYAVQCRPETPRDSAVPSADETGRTEHNIKGIPDVFRSSCSAHITKAYRRQTCSQLVKQSAGPDGDVPRGPRESGRWLPTARTEYTQSATDCQERLLQGPVSERNAVGQRPHWLCQPRGSRGGSSSSRQRGRIEAARNDDLSLDTSGTVRVQFFRVMDMFKSL